MDEAIRYMNEAWRKVIAHEARELVERKCQRSHNQDKKRSDSMTTLLQAGALRTWKRSRLAGRPSGRRRSGMGNGS